MAEINTNWCQSVGGVVLRDGRVLLARHTYGAGKGRLIIPGGYVQMGESPEDALRREVYEETGVRVEPRGILGVRFNAKDWYVVFAADYAAGDARSDQDENDLVVWLPVAEALASPDVPDLTKRLIARAAQGAAMLTPAHYDSIQANPGRLYATQMEENL